MIENLIKQYLQVVKLYTMKSPEGIIRKIVDPEVGLALRDQHGWVRIAAEDIGKITISDVTFYIKPYTDFASSVDEAIGVTNE